MISHFDLNFLLNNFDEVQSLGTRQFCSSQMDHNMASRFWFAQNINLKSVAIPKPHGLQDLAFPAHQAHSSFTVENSATTTMLFNCFTSSFVEPHYLNCTMKQFSSRESNTKVHSFLEKTDPQKSNELGTVVCITQVQKYLSLLLLSTVFHIT